MAIGFILVLGLLNFRGISESVAVNLVMTLVEVTGLVIILVVGAAVLGSGDANLRVRSSSTPARARSCWPSRAPRSRSSR